MTTEYVDIVDQNDKVIGVTERSKLTPVNIYRCSSLWISNGKGQVLLAKRALTKAYNPGKWGLSAVGTVSAGETYRQAMNRELSEELGVSDVEFREVKKVFSQSRLPHFTQLYRATLDYPIEKFTLQESEVAEIKWFDESTLAEKISKNPELFTTRMPKVIKNYLS